MKRSEALNLIKSVLCDDTSDDAQYAEWILSELENAGMAPPEVISFDIITLGAGVSLSSVKKERKWENE